MLRISLGSDCSIAYNLQRLGYRKFSFPFDWILSRDLSVLTNDFQDFLDVNFLKIKGKVNFCKVDEDFSHLEEEMLRIKHVRYDLEFLHDFTNFEDIKIVKEKYDRRIERFYSVMRDEKIEKHLYRISKYDEREEIEKIFVEKNFVNFQLHIKLYSEFPPCKDWKRLEFNWETWFGNF